VTSFWNRGGLSSQDQPISVKVVHTMVGTGEVGQVESVRTQEQIKSHASRQGQWQASTHALPRFPLARTKKTDVPFLELQSLSARPGGSLCNGFTVADPQSGTKQRHCLPAPLPGSLAHSDTYCMYDHAGRMPAWAKASAPGGGFHYCGST
jgi:hypothetical protein